MVLSNTYMIRAEGVDFDPKAIYEGYPNMFSIELHHGGKFTRTPKPQYNQGSVTYVDQVDIDKFSVFEMDKIMQLLGYPLIASTYYQFRLAEGDFEFGLRPLGSDLDVLYLALYVGENKLIEVYTEHYRTNLLTYCMPPGLNVASKGKVVIEELHDDDDLLGPIPPSTVVVPERKTKGEGLSLTLTLGPYDNAADKSAHSTVVLPQRQEVDDMSLELTLGINYSPEYTRGRKKKKHICRACCSSVRRLCFDENDKGKAVIGTETVIEQGEHGFIGVIVPYNVFEKGEHENAGVIVPYNVTEKGEHGDVGIIVPCTVFGKGDNGNDHGKVVNQGGIGAVSHDGASAAFVEQGNVHGKGTTQSVIGAVNDDGASGAFGEHRNVHEGVSQLVMCVTGAVSDEGAAGEQGNAHEGVTQLVMFVDRDYEMNDMFVDADNHFDPLSANEGDSDHGVEYGSEDDGLDYRYEAEDESDMYDSDW